MQAQQQPIHPNEMLQPSYHLPPMDGQQYMQQPMDPQQPYMLQQQQMDNVSQMSPVPGRSASPYPGQPQQQQVMPEDPNYYNTAYNATPEHPFSSPQPPIPTPSGLRSATASPHLQHPGYPQQYYGDQASVQSNDRHHYPQSQPLQPGYGEPVPMDEAIGQQAFSNKGIDPPDDEPPSLSRMGGRDITPQRFGRGDEYQPNQHRQYPQQQPFHGQTVPIGQQYFQGEERIDPQQLYPQGEKDSLGRPYFEQQSPEESRQVQVHHDSNSAYRPDFQLSPDTKTDGTTTEYFTPSEFMSPQTQTAEPQRFSYTGDGTYQRTTPAGSFQEVEHLSPMSDPSPASHGGTEAPYSDEPKLKMKPNSSPNSTDSPAPNEAGDSSQPQSPNSTSDYSRTSAMKGAQELLRRNRQRRLEAARKRLETEGPDDEPAPSPVQPSATASSSAAVHSISVTPRSASGESESDDLILSPRTDSESGAWESGSASVVSGSSVWTDSNSLPDRSSRRALILQMAKARMRNNKTGGSVSSPISAATISEKGTEDSANADLENPSEEEKKLESNDIDLTGDLD